MDETQNITSDTAKAKEYLKTTGATATPDGVRDALWSGNPGHVTGSTLARKFRDAAQRGELLKSRYVNAKGRSIALYSFNYKEGT